MIIHIIVSYDQNISVIFHVKDGSHVRLWHGCDIRIVFTLPPRDRTLQYKRCVHLWNNFPCIITLGWIIKLLEARLQCTAGEQSTLSGFIKYMQIRAVLPVATRFSKYLCREGQEGPCVQKYFGYTCVYAS